MIRICLFKEKEKEGGEGRSQFGGQWKFLMLGGQWEVPMFGGLWKEKKKEKHLFTIFSIDLKVLFYHGSRP